MADATLRTAVLDRLIAAVGATTDATTILGKADFAGTLTAASFVPNAAITGATSDKFTLTIVNKGATGVGTTVMATLDFTNTVNGVAFDEKAFTLGVAANLVVAAGDVLAVVSTHTGSTGLANPGGLVFATLTASVA